MAATRDFVFLLVIAIFSVCNAGVIWKDNDVPTWTNSYQVEGVLQLPYAEIKEPFMAYFDGINKRSRVDYYGDLVQTMQRGDVGSFGSSYKVAYMTNYKVTNKKTCFQVNGTSANDAVTVQSVLPDLTGFKKLTTETVNGMECDKWQMIQMIGKKKNTYSMWVATSNAAPVRYEMRGYDSLLGSHYDRYYIDYQNFQFNVTLNVSLFIVPTDIKCAGFPGPGNKEHKILVNPMKEYIHKFDEHIDEMFDHFHKTHNPQYKSVKEFAQRQHIFRQNVRFIHSNNRATRGYTLAVNNLADQSSEELQLRNGYRYTKGSHGGLPFHTSKFDAKDLPDSMDWRLRGAVTPVKDQGVCGSCWSFGTTGTIEGAYFLKTGNLVRLSQQELMDCSWGEGNNACDGGEDFRSYQWIMKNKGLTSDDQYGQYLAQDGMCHKDSVQPVVMLKNYVNVTTGDQQALKFAIVNQGPVSVAIDASHKSLSFYSNGVYYEPKCGNTPDDLDHAVLAVGYGVLNGEAYWLIKNSWSTYWGMDGFVLMSQKDNNCGVATAATFVMVE